MATVQAPTEPRGNDEGARALRIRDAFKQLMCSRPDGPGLRGAVEQLEHELEKVRRGELAEATGALTARLSHAVADLHTSWSASKALPWNVGKLAARPAVLDAPTPTTPPIAAAESSRAVVATEPPLVIERSPRYQLGERLGVGGMGEVFRGWQVGADGFERVVAVKRIAPQFAHSERYRRLLREEACITARLSHPNIVSALDFVNCNGAPLLVLEYVDGVDLHMLIASGPLPPSVVLFLAAELLSGLGYVHRLPAVHRDLSPHNILLSWNGAVKIADFGIAKLRTEAEVSAWKHLAGKPGFMSPEQLRGQPLDGRADLFSLGVILWEMLAGRRLYPHEPATVLSDRPPRPSEFRKVPLDLERVVMKLLRRRREQRYSTAEVALDALARCEGVSAFRGRVELVELLAQRFPGRAARRPTRRPRLPTTPTPRLTAPALKRASLRVRYHWWRRQRRWARQRRRARRLDRGWSGAAIAVACVVLMLGFGLMMCAVAL